MVDLRHHIPMAVYVVARTEIFMKEQMTAELRAVVFGIQIAVVDDAAEARFRKEPVRVVDRPGYTTVKLLGGRACRADRGADMKARMQQLILPVRVRIVAEGVEKQHDVRHHAVLVIMTVLDR